MTDAQRSRYEAAYYKLLGEVTTLDAMVATYPEPDAADDVKLAYELEDLGRPIYARTAERAAIPGGRVFAAGRLPPPNRPA